MYGYCILFLAILLENIFFLGLIVPGETIFLLGSLHVNNRLFVFDLFISQEARKGVGCLQKMRFCFF